MSSILPESTYMKKYVGNVHKTRTESYKKNGINMKTYSIKPTNYRGLFKIIKKQPHKDITGYIKNGNVHSSKTFLDRAAKSKKQSWEKK